MSTMHGQTTVLRPIRFLIKAALFAAWCVFAVRSVVTVTVEVLDLPGVIPLMLCLTVVPYVGAAIVEWLLPSESYERSRETE